MREDFKMWKTLSESSQILDWRRSIFKLSRLALPTKLLKKISKGVPYFFTSIMSTENAWYRSKRRNIREVRLLLWKRGLMTASNVSSWRNGIRSYYIPIKWTSLCRYYNLKTIKDGCTNSCQTLLKIRIPRKFWNIWLKNESRHISNNLLTN